MRMILTQHALERLDEKTSKIAPELLDIDRLKNLIIRSGIWYYSGKEETYYCVISHLHVCVFTKGTDPDELVLVTMYPFTKHFKATLNHCERTDVDIT